MTEEEKRIITLEAIVQAMYDCYEKVREVIPATTPKLELGDKLMMGLYNSAEVRKDIASYVEMKVDWE